jgi:hypothetical protein
LLLHFAMRYLRQQSSARRYACSSVDFALSYSVGVIEP